MQRSTGNLTVSATWPQFQAPGHVASMVLAG
jgi:hypothetical protein